MKKAVLASLVVALTLPLTTTYAGGWAVITVDDLPERIVANETVTLRFSVRQHGSKLLTDLSPSIAASRNGVTNVTAARATSQLGSYVAELRLPQPGAWTVTIDSGFVTSKLTLPPLTAVAPSAPVAPALPPAKRGQELFVVKGCASCHYHGAIGARPIASVGKDLTAMRYPDDFLGTLLKDPSFLPPANGPWTMPNLNLRDQEIAALVAFINQPSGTTTTQR